MAPRFLMVEDNQADVALMSEALDETAVTHDIDVAPDGEEAMDFLQRRGRHANAPRPDMILLDLNLPRLNGREVLERIKQDPALHKSRWWCSRAPRPGATCRRRTTFTQIAIL